MLRIILLLIADSIAIPIILIIAYGLKFKLGYFYNIVFNVSSGTVYTHAQLEPYIHYIEMIGVIWIISLIAMGSYRTYTGIMASVDQTISVIKSTVLAIGIILIVSFFIELMPFSKTVLVYLLFIGGVILQINRIIIDQLWGLTYYKPQSYCIVGCGKDAQFLLERLQYKTHALAYQGSFYDVPSNDTLFSIKEIWSNCGTIKHIKPYLQRNNIQHLFVNSLEISNEKAQDLVLFCETYGIKIHFYNADQKPLSAFSFYEDILGMPIVSYSTVTYSWRQYFIKRLIDLIVALTAIVLFIPLWISIACWIKWVDPKGPVIFKQVRVGQYGKEFLMYKFRTMCHDAESASGPQWVSKNDNRYIKGGLWLRKFSFDELPQLFNIIKNDMSLIGPRPERPYFVDKISKEDPFFKLRHNVKGGITGWAQIHGRAYLTRRPIDKLQYDLFYIKKWSLVLDIKICLKTISLVLKGEEAY